MDVPMASSECSCKVPPNPPHGKHTIQGHGTILGVATRIVFLYHEVLAYIFHQYQLILSLTVFQVTLKDFN